MVSTTDIIASMTSQQRYLPFGGVREDIGSISQTDFGYTGQRNLDEGIGLMDYRARFYSPLLNRFIQPDSIVPNPMNPQAWNRFSYGLNNPLIYTDPSGHYPICQPGARCLVPLADQRDLTTWVVAAAVDIAESSDMGSIRYANDNAQKISAWAQFYFLVKDGAKYDVKDKIQDQIGNDTKIGNEWYEYSTAGNILYGFYGTDAGFTEAKLRAGAGLAQTLDYNENPAQGIGPCGYPYFCDTEVDYYAVGFGIYLYDNYYKDDKKLTRADLLDAFENYENADKMDIINKPNDFQPRYYNYPINRFYQMD